MFYTSHFPTPTRNSLPCYSPKIISQKNLKSKIEKHHTTKYNKTTKKAKIEKEANKTSLIWTLNTM